MMKKIKLPLLVFLSLVLTAIYFYVKTRTPSDAIAYALPIEHWLKDNLGISLNYDLIFPLFEMFFLLLSTLCFGALLSRYLQFSHKIPKILCLLPQVWLVILMMIIFFGWMPQNEGIVAHLILVSYHELLPYSYLVLLFSSTLFFLRKKNLVE